MSINIRPEALNILPLIALVAVAKFWGVNLDTKLPVSQLPSDWRYPAEWESHRAVWLAWPYHLDLWQSELPAAQKEFVKLVENLSHGDPVKLLCHNADARDQAQAALSHLKIEYHLVGYGDIWVRDTGALFFKRGNDLCAKTFRFNGWGEKYLFEEDPLIAEQMAKLAHSQQTLNSQWILEGGALEWDGQGTLLTTRECLLNNNRCNPYRHDQKAMEHLIQQELGVRSVAWITQGLLNDHTDGHIDTIARFVAPGVVVCMEAQSSSDPQRDRLKSILADLKNVRDARGAKLEIFTVPAPGAVLNDEGDVMPASYMNFYMGNGLVAVPTYETSQDDLALKALEPLFKGRTLYASPSIAILNGGGSFHCITQQEPL